MGVLGGIYEAIQDDSRLKGKSGLKHCKQILYVIGSEVHPLDFFVSPDREMRSVSSNRWWGEG